MEKLSNPIFDVYNQYLLKDEEFTNLLFDKVFGKIDKDILFNDVITNIERLVGLVGLKNLKREKLETLMKICDINKDNKYNTFELKLLILQVLRLIVDNMWCHDSFDNMLSFAYKSLDSDKSGYIDYKEIEPILAKYVEANPIVNYEKATVRKIFDELDKDGNGKLDISEISLFVGKLTEAQFSAMKLQLKNK